MHAHIFYIFLGGWGTRDIKHGLQYKHPCLSKSLKVKGSTDHHNNVLQANSILVAQ